MGRVPVEERRKQLVSAAIKVISEKGVAAATVRAIAKEAEAPVATIHYAFSSHLALLQAIMEQLTRESKDYAAGVSIPAGAPATVVIRAYLEAYLEGVRKHRSRELGTLELNLHALRDDRLKPLAAELYRGYYRATTELARKISELTGLSWSVPIRQVSRFAVMVTDGLVLSHLGMNDDEVSEDLIQIATLSLSNLLVHPVGTTKEQPRPDQDDTRISASQGALI